MIVNHGHEIDVEYERKSVQQGYATCQNLRCPREAKQVLLGKNGEQDVVTVTCGGNSLTHQENQIWYPVKRQPETEHTVLVAFTVQGRDWRDAQESLSGQLRDVAVTGPVTSWWIAEDDRVDGSDNDSAVFCHPGRQGEASRLLFGNSLTPYNNIVGPE